MFGQNCWKPATHSGQVPSESTMCSRDRGQIPAASTLVTAAPTLAGPGRRSPWPGTIWYMVPPHSLRAEWRARNGRMPQKRMSSWTSFSSVGSRRVDGRWRPAARSRWWRNTLWRCTWAHAPVLRFLVTRASSGAETLEFSSSSAPSRVLRPASYPLPDLALGEARRDVLRTVWPIEGLDRESRLKTRSMVASYCESPVRAIHSAACAPSKSWAWPGEA